MPSSGTAELETLVRYLRQSGLDLEGDPAHGVFTVEARGEGPVTRVEITEDVLVAYLDELEGHRRGQDPRESARGLAMVHVIDHLTTDHGGGTNFVRTLSLVRDRRGIRFVEERDEAPPPTVPPFGESYVWSAEPGVPRD